MLNIKVRLKQKWFWITLIPLLFLAIDQIVELVATIVVYFNTYTIGSELSGSALEALVISLIGTIFAIVALIGFPVDTTTDGYGDSARALTYEEPAPNASEFAKVVYVEEEEE